MNYLYFILGLFFGVLFLEPLVINFIYFSNISLFEDIILTSKNSQKLEDYYYKKLLKGKIKL